MRVGASVCVPYRRGEKTYGKEEDTHKEENTNPKKSADKEETTSEETKRDNVYW